MTNDDREDARRGEEGGYEPSRWRNGRTAPGAGPRLGGLLDGLPESGRGTRAQQSRGTAGQANPFRQGPAPQEPAPEEPGKPQAPHSNPQVEPGPASSYGTPPLDLPPAAAAPQAPPEAAPRSEPPADTPPPTGPPPAGRPQRPNVIPFRSGERTPGPEAAGHPAEPDTGYPARAARQGPSDHVPGQDPEHEEPAAPMPTTNHEHADQHPVITETEQNMHAHEAAALAAEPQHTEPPGPRPVQPMPEPAGATAPARTDGWSGHAYDDADRAAVYRALRGRRDVRVGFRPDPVPHEVLIRVLEAAHQVPGVGRAQPWDFLVINDPELRTRVSGLTGARAENVLDAPLNIAVTVDPTRSGQHTPGRHAKPMSARHAAALAVENLWIAARAEGLGLGWVTFADEHDVALVLDLPSHVDVVAYLCVGYVEEFPAEPGLSPSGWAEGRPLSWAVHHDRYGHRGLPGQEPTSLLEETITAIGALNTRAMEEARGRQDRMTKPPGSLGVLEEVSVQLAGLAGECPPPIPEPAAVAVFAGDHGVHAQGVTAWPQEVTAQMVHNFLEGGAVVNAFAAQVGAEVTVVDVGVVGDLPRAAGLLPRKVARGTADFTQGPALTRKQALQALEGGIEVARDLVSAGSRCLITGDMGIANTTPAAALVCAFTGADPEHATGRGTGVDDAMYEHKVGVVRRALAANPVDQDDPVGTLAALGGLEHAALAGFILGGAALRVPVLLDGVIAGSAALVAAAISPHSVNAFFAGHRSSEPGHSLVLEHLGLRPLVDLEMRLGEGSGALLALPLLQGSARVLRDVATFDDAGVSTAR